MQYFGPLTISHGFNYRENLRALGYSVLSFVATVYHLLVVCFQHDKA